MNICSSVLVSRAGWEVQNPLPTEACLFTVEPVTDKTVFVGGLGGTLLYTTDGGETWKVRKFQDMVNIRGISFTDSLTGWILDSHNVYQTSDGGANWKVIHIDVDLSTYVFLDIVCFANVIYLFLKPWTAVLDELIHAKSLLLKSTDGGKTWNRLDIDIAGKMLCAFFLNENCGFIYVEEVKSISESYTSFYRTCDGAKTWIKSRFPESQWTLGMHFINKDTGFVGQYRTSDCGKTWKNVFTDCLRKDESIEDIFFEDSLQGWAVSWFTILQTTNGGLSWKKVHQRGSHRLMDIDFSRNRTGWIVGWAGNIYRKDPEKNLWKRVSTGTTHNLRDVFFLNEKKGWCVGNRGLILHTDNGGYVWEQQQSNTDSILFKVKFLNHQEGWAVGHGVVLHTNDGGNIWQSHNDLKWWFTDIDFFNQDQGLLIKRSGAVFRTNNSGQDWYAVTEKPISQQLTSLEVVNENEAWIGGWGGLAHTSDMGETIQWYYYPNLSLVQDIQFFNNNYGWLVNDHGILLETNDGGKIWKEIPRGNGVESGPITAFFLLDHENAWIYWDFRGGYLRRIINNQKLTATKEEYGIHPIHAIYFVNSNTGWAVGNGGTILKYTWHNEIPMSELLEKRLNIFPNPFNENGMNITFTLQQIQFVTVQAFNLRGQKVQTIFRGWLSKGYKTLFWTPDNVASGIYLVSVQCDLFEQTEQCTYIHH